MQIKDTGMGYGVVTLIVHWLGGVIMIATLAVGLILGQIDISADKDQLLTFHMSAGTLIFVLSIFRLYWRWRYYLPLPLGPADPVAVIMARGIALGLLSAGLLLSLAGGLAVYNEGVPISLFGLFPLPVALEPSKGLARAASIFHQIGAYALIAGLLLHIFGALKHHFVYKDQTVARMLGKKTEL